ncbi:MAG TPA: SpoIIE family protein phosphatase [Longimicrobium sp.]|nr:SpoIIE family protein phosphatase [Longimicrobium sp.]
MDVVSGALSLPVTDPSGAGEARRQVVRLVEALGFDETAAGRVAIAATEAATNLAKHSPSGGVVLARPCRRGEAVGIEILCVDRGPGMANPAECMRDGYSTAGSPGTGLGALERLSDDFDLFSTPGVGTVLLSRIWAVEPGPAETGISVGAVVVAKPGQEVCGDDAGSEEREGRTTMVVADGLGHGPDAAEASRAAMRVLRENPGEAPGELLHRMHAALRPTRGAAVLAVRIDARTGMARGAGVGNISGSVVTPDGGSRSLVSHNGIVGHEMRKVQEFEIPWPTASALVMHSDGIGSRWSLERYPGLLGRDPAVIAAVLYRDFCRGTDDATVLVAREVHPA